MNKFFSVTLAISVILCSCDNKQKEQQSEDSLVAQTVHVQESEVEDSLGANCCYLSNKGTEILCMSNTPKLSADLSAKSKLSESEIKAFVAKMKVQPTKELSFYYEGLDLPPYATMSGGVVNYNNDIPNTLAEAKKYQQRLESEKRSEKERLEKTRKAIRKSIIGNWASETSPELTFCIYKRNGKYYAGKLDKDTYNISELYRLARVSSRRYEDRDNGDMPERFDIMPNGSLKTTTYNPDAPGGGAWVYMGTWYAIDY